VIAPWCSRGSGRSSQVTSRRWCDQRGNGSKIALHVSSLAFFQEKLLMVTLRCQPASNDLLRLWPISVITGCLYCPVVFLVLLSPLLSLCFRSRRIRPLRCGLFCGFNQRLSTRTPALQRRTRKPPGPRPPQQPKSRLGRKRARKKGAAAGRELSHRRRCGHRRLWRSL